MSGPLVSEDAVLRVIDGHFPSRGRRRALIDRGDDCFVLRRKIRPAISTDLFMEDVHFRRSYFSAEDIGYKALAVNLSDLAATGAKPLGFSLGLALPDDVTMEYVDGLFRGLALCAEGYGISLTGGDLSKADKLHLCVTVMGESRRDGALRRGNVRPGDAVILCGSVGLAKAGLAVLEASGVNSKDEWPVLTHAHLRPMPSIKAGLALSKLQRHGLRISAMDVSDGLARDLPRLLSRCGADVTLPEPHPELASWATACGGTRGARDLLRRTMLLGGEDYALLAACEPKGVPLVLRSVPGAVTIGTVTASGLSIDGEALTERGFDHFADQ